IVSRPGRLDHEARSRPVVGVACIVRVHPAAFDAAATQCTSGRDSGYTMAKLTSEPADPQRHRTTHEDGLTREERSMTARRVLAGLGLLLAACTTAACAQVVTGTGAAAPDVQGQVTASPSGPPTPSDDSPSSSSSPSPSVSSSSAGGN